MQSNVFMKPNTNLVPRDKTTKAVPAQTRGGPSGFRRAVWEAEARLQDGSRRSYYVLQELRRRQISGGTVHCLTHPNERPPTSTVKEHIF